jgi:hypothetical protein
VFLAVLRSSAVRENIPRGLPRGMFNLKSKPKASKVPDAKGALSLYRLVRDLLRFVEGLCS